MQQALSIDAAAEKLGVSRYTLRAWLRQRRVPFHRLGRRVLLDAEDVERFFRAHRVEAREGG